MSDVLIAERRGAIMIVTINRPQVRNALNLEVAERIAAALQELDGDPALRVGILTGAGGSFSAGMDLKAFGEGEIPIVDGGGFGGFAAQPPEKPLIAAVEGHALAGGFEIALACDLIVASRDATFGLPEVRRSLFAAAGGLIRLSRRIPYNLAMELALTGAPIDASRAERIGIVNHVTEPAGALPAALDLARQIAANGPLGVAASKRVLGYAGEIGESASWRRQAALFEEVTASEDAREGAAAFVEKREPVWRGR